MASSTDARYSTPYLATCIGAARPHQEFAADWYRELADRSAGCWTGRSCALGVLVGSWGEVRKLKQWSPARCCPVVVGAIADQACPYPGDGVGGHPLITAQFPACFAARHGLPLRLLPVSPCGLFEQAILPLHELGMLACRLLGRRLSRTSPRMFPPGENVQARVFRIRPNGPPSWADGGPRASATTAGARAEPQLPGWRRV